MDYLKAKADSLWSGIVRHTFNHQCVYCGAQATDAHHIRGKAAYPLLRYEPLNGIAVCRRCHCEIHSNPDIIEYILKRFPAQLLFREEGYYQWEERPKIQIEEYIHSLERLLTK